MYFEEYESVYKSGLKDFKKQISKGEYPYLQVLDEILSYTEIASEVNLGVVEIPMEQIVGTKTAGRTNAFASNFMPLLPADSEFALKWCNLYEAHLKEGIRDPVKAYEFMNRFYIEEGNKRVSVLKHCDAVTVPGVVTRIIPMPDDSEECKIYYEFLDFYKKTEINYLNFSQQGSFTKILEILGLTGEEMISAEAKNLFRSNYVLFRNAFEKKGGEKLSLTKGDAFLLYINIYGYDDIASKSSEELQAEITKIWNDFAFYPQKTEVRLIMDADKDAEKVNLVRMILPLPTETLKIAFIHSKSAETSSWTYGHDLGSNHLKEVLGDKVEISSFFDADTPKMQEAHFEQAISEGNTVIFTTSSKLLSASTKYALKYPKLRILNCSLNTSNTHVRTYYGRLHEAKFLIGAIAGIMSPTNKAGYQADYPLFGTIANINAFALGAKMVNPNMKVYLEWPKLKKEFAKSPMEETDLAFISGRDFIRPDEGSGDFGLYSADDDGTHSLAMSVWNWGIFYEQIVKSMLNGTWKQELPKGKNESLNYWWGLSSGMIDVICSKRLPEDTMRLIELLKKSICNGDFSPFSGRISTNEGTVYHDIPEEITAEEIITMDWLADNVIGFIPTMDQMEEDAKSIIQVQGVAKAKEAEGENL